MQDIQYDNNLEQMITRCLLKILLEDKAVNQPTYDKILKIIKVKEAA